MVRRFGLVASLALVGLIGVIDFVTGTELRVYPLYFAPLALSASSGRPAVVVIAIACSACWAVANRLGNATFTEGWYLVFNTVIQLGAFLLVGLLVHALRRRAEQDRALARIDPLTDVWNARAFQERVDLEIGRARRNERPLTIAYIDLDGFKEVNDRAGHEGGDAVLREAAATLTQSVRGADTVSRLGGDEFALLLPDTDHAGATALLERIRSAIAARMLDLGHPVTASIGGVSFATAPSDVSAAISRADEAMYVAKRGGKNRVQLEYLP